MIKPLTSIRKSAIIGMVLISALTMNAQNNRKKVVKVDEISYEHNHALDERIKGGYINQAEVDEYYKKLGTYGASIELQRLKGEYVKYIAHPAVDNLSGTELWEAHEKCFYKFPDAVKEYIETSRAKTAEELYKNGVPTAKECLRYLNSKVEKDATLSNSDYSKYMRDIRRFKKAQGNVITNQSVAELIAYKQFKIDSLAYRKILASFGFLNNEKIKKDFEKGSFPKNVSPKPVANQ